MVVGMQKREILYLSTCTLKNDPDFLEIIPGRLLRADITIDNNSFSFFNIYAPNIGSERNVFFRKFSDELMKCPQDNYCYNRR